jgi:lipopolysaccharide transport system ATP-binding protein
MNTAIKVENLSKIYRLGEIGTGTISRDMERWFKTRILKQEDPFLKIGETNDRTTKGTSDFVYSLQNINFEINQGDAVGIIGRNGAGKSTLLKILSRVTTPTTGKINIKGRVASLLEVGTGFHPELTGRENIYLNGAILGMRKREIDRKLDEIIDFSGVERYIDTPVKRYSSGMYVRLAFAVAAHLESEILIVDEVLAVGDAEFQKKCLGKMGEVSKGEGRTVLFVSHNLSSVKALCNKGIYLKNGALNYHGRIDSTIENYLNGSYENKGISIADRIDKIGNKKIEIIDVSFKNQNNLCITELFSGDYIKIEFQFDKNSKIDLKDMIVACNFSDNYEHKIVTWVSDEMTQDFGNLLTNSFTLEIPNLNLRPGGYNFNYQISYRDTAPESFCDVLEKALVLTVMDTDFFKQGINVRPAHSALLKAKFF